MEVIDVGYFPNSVHPGSNLEQSEFHSYISDDNEQDTCDSHDHMFHILKKLFDSRILGCVMSTVWEDTVGCAKQNIFGVAIYLMTLYHLHM